MSETTTAPSVQRLALGDLYHEFAATRRVLERVPDEHLAWKPHPKSFSIGALASHIANLASWISVVMTQDELDLAGQGRQPEPTSSEQIVRAFDENVAKVREVMAAADDSVFGKTWTLRMGDHVILQMPRLAVVRSMTVNHIVHHRGQLTVYLRLLDVPVPGMYGPTADEQASF